MAEEYPEDAHWLQPADRDFIPEDWHELYFRAFDELRYDRHYGAFGGETPISFLARQRYADEIGLPASERSTFHLFMRALDAEYLERRAAMTKTK